MNSGLSESPPAELAVPPKLVPAPNRLNWVLLPGLAGLLVACAVLFRFNPAQYGFYPVCLFHRLTGLNCPGCGGLRAVHQLLHGHLITAFHSNALFVAGLPVVAWWGLRQATRQLRNQPAVFRVPPAALWWFLGAAIAFTLLRNLPGFAWLAP